MTKTPPSQCPALGGALFLCLAALAAPAPAAPGAAKPAFLDAPDQITVAVDRPTAAASLLNRVSVRLGAASVPVTRVEAVGTPDRADEVVLAGTFQSALGGSDWDTDDARTRMAEVAPRVFELQVRLPPGNYRYKVTRGGGFAENYGADFQPNGKDIPLAVPAGAAPILFRVDLARRVLQTSLDTPGLSPSAGRLPPAGSRTLRLTLGRRLGPGDITRPLSLRFADGTTRPIFARDVLSGPDYFYGGADLGATYSRAATTFKVWSPVSSSATLLLFKSAASATARPVPLRRLPAGVWGATVPGDLDGVFYQYRFTSYGRPRTAPDLYGRAASEDLRRSMVVDLGRTDPAGFRAAPAPRLAAPTDAVVYEIHTRDFTVDPAGGVPPALRGTYLGLVAPGTRVPDTDRPTGLDYLRTLGVTHVHLLPFQSIALENSKGYNWGYETDLFNVPEPRYATRPGDPEAVIREVKTMVAGLHRAGLGLVMDVVYNHAVPVSGDASPFWATVPYYYFRTDASGGLLNESGVGNALDDERPMVRKFVCDSLAYWAAQYRVDGFRFDLLGMWTPETVAALSQALRRVRPDVLLYGEPWTGGGPTRFGKGAQRGLGVAVFNDNFRNLVRGDLNGTKPGFALGGPSDPALVRAAVSGSPEFAASPTESINYVSIHDDKTLWDKITSTLPGPPPGPAPEQDSDRRALKLAGAMVLLSQGVPILEGGAELGRTKQGQSNSYNLGDAVNRFDWRRGLAFADVSDYYRGLIALRRAHPAFRRATADAVRRTLTFLPEAGLPAQTVAFTLDGTPSGDPWRRILVVFHGGTGAGTLALPPGHWHLAVGGGRADTQGAALPAAPLSLEPLSTTVLYEETN